MGHCYDQLGACLGNITWVNFPGYVNICSHPSLFINRCNRVTHIYYRNEHFEGEKKTVLSKMFYFKKSCTQRFQSGYNVIFSEINDETIKLRLMFWKQLSVDKSVISHIRTFDWSILLMKWSTAEFSPHSPNQ